MQLVYNTIHKKYAEEILELLRNKYDIQFHLKLNPYSEIYSIKCKNLEIKELNEIKIYCNKIHKELKLIDNKLWSDMPALMLNKLSKKEINNLSNKKEKE